MVHSLSFSQIAPCHHRYSHRNPHRTPPPSSSAVPVPAGAFSIFPHCRSSVRSRRSLFYTSPLPQQCPLPQEPFLYFSAAAAVSAPAGGFSIFPHCRSSVRSRRSLIYTSPLPQQCPLPQEPFLYFPTAAAVSTPTFYTPHPPRCHSSTRSRSRSFLLDTAALLQAVSSIPSALSHTILGDFYIWLLSHDKVFWGAFWVWAKRRVWTPLPGRGEYPRLGNNYRARSPLLGQHAKYA